MSIYYFKNLHKIYVYLKNKVEQFTSISDNFKGYTFFFFFTMMQNLQLFSFIILSWEVKWPRPTATLVIFRVYSHLKNDVLHTTWVNIFAIDANFWGAPQDHLILVLMLKFLPRVVR